MQLARLYRAYQDTLVAYQAMDFDDLILLPVRLFADNAEALRLIATGEVPAEATATAAEDEDENGTDTLAELDEQIAETIRVGINSANPDSRVSKMLAFGRDQVKVHS